MVKIISALSVMLLICACAGNEAANTKSGTSVSAGNSFWITRPQAGSVVIIGVSGRTLTRNTAIENAREDAARKASMYHSVYVYSESIQDIGSGFLDYYAATDTTIRYNDQLEFYKERLTFDPDRDVLTNDNGVYVRFTYPVSFPGFINYSFARNLNDRPEWINNAPREIGGYMVGVGFSAKLFKRSDTFDKSCESAAAALVSQLSTRITTRGVSDSNQSTSVIIQTSEGRLSNFLVLEIWVDPQTNAVWTLAIAQRAS